MLFSKAASQIVVVIFLLSDVHPVDGRSLAPIEIRGSKFFQSSSGSQFFLQGVIYQEVPANDEQGSISSNLARSIAEDIYLDPLAQTDACRRDIPYLTKLQANVVRSYAIDPSKVHDDCMNAFARAGIYVIVDLAAPGQTIGTNNPVWNDALYGRYTDVIDSMHNYTNVLGFVVGDNLVQGIGPNDSGPYVKAAVRDTKAHIRHKGYRSIPVGYVNDILQNAASLDPLARDVWGYLNCGDANERIDFFGANVYTFCSGDSGQYGALSDVITQDTNYSAPLFFAAFGCSQSGKSDLSNSSLILGSDPASNWSGGLAYEYFEQGPGDGYGLVSVDAYSLRELPNFAKLATAIASATGPSKSVNSATYTPSQTAAAICPSGAAISLPPKPRAAAVSPSSTSKASSTVSNLDPSAAATAASEARSGLSNGARAGIGIGVAIPIVALFAAVFLLLRRRRQKKQNLSQNEQWTKTELAADDLDREARGYGPHMADSVGRAEVDGNSAIPEAPGDKAVLEKPGKGDTVTESFETPLQELSGYTHASEKE